MTRVDFYLLGAAAPQAARAAACRVVDKAFRQGLTVTVRTADEAGARAMDELLWTFRADSFVPHEPAAAGAEAPVLIAHQDGPCEGEVLVNLSGRVPAADALPARVAEFVAGDEASRAAARERYRDYRALGCELLTHEL